MLRSSLNNFLLPNVVMPLAARLTENKGWQYYQQFLASDFEPPEQRRERQWSRLKRLIEHAYRNTGYYRDRMDAAGLTPDGIQTPADLRRMPVTTKQDLRDNFPDGIISRTADLERVRVSNTSGTAGVPLVLAQDNDDINHKYASKLRTRHLMGAELGDRVLRLAPNECQPCFSDGSSPDVDLLRLLRMRLSGHPDYHHARYIFLERKVINPIVHQRAFPPPLDADNLHSGVEHYLELLKSYRPEVLAGHPLYLYLVARQVEKRGERIEGLKAVDCTGDLSTARLRSYLSRQFNAPAFQIYGGCEWGRLCGSCAHSEGPMHMLDDLCYVEFLDPDGQPVEERVTGNIIITSLTNYTMPLIRFEHGDVGWFTDEPCGCGRTSRRMDVEGRLQALIVTTDNRPVFTSDLFDRLVPNPGVVLPKVTQLGPSRFEVSYLADPDQPLDEAAMRASLLEVLGQDAELEIRALDRLQPAPSGKFRLVHSTSYQSYRCVTPDRREVELGEYW